MNTHSGHGKQRGFSLVELMIGMVLGLITTSVVIFIFLSNHNISRTDTSISRVQEDARFIQSYLSKFIRMAGYRGCLSKQSIPVNTTLKMATTLAYKFTVGIEGYDNVNSPLPSDVTSLLAATDPVPVAGTDILILRGPVAESVSVPQANDNSYVYAGINANKMGSSCAIGNRISDLCVGSLIMLSDCKKAKVFQVTDMNVVSGANATQVLSIGHATGTLSPGNAFGDWSPMINKLDSFGPGSEIYEYQTQTFYIGIDPKTAQRSLYVKINNLPAEVLVDYVRDMQVSYGIDQNMNRQVDSYAVAASVTNWNSVISVRVEFLLYSADDNVVNAPQVISFNGANIIMPDNKWYLPVAVTSTIRNRIS